MDKFEEAWKENRHVWESSKNLAKAMYLAGQQSRQAEVDELNQLYLKAQHQEIRHRTIAQDALALVEEKDKRVEAALFQMRQQALSLKEDCDGYKDPVGICQSEGVDWCVRFLEKALQGFQGDRS